MSKTNIGYLKNPDGSKGETWNLVLGCGHKSPGCENCWAEAVSVAHANHPNTKIADAYAGLTRDGKWTGEVRLMHERLNDPRHWRKPRVAGVSFMADLLQPKVPFEFIAQVYWEMFDASDHIFLMLTKWPGRLKEFIDGCRSTGGYMKRARPNGGVVNIDLRWPLENVWLGVSVEGPEQYDRILELQKIPAAKRWISLEPLLGPVDDLPLDGIDLVVLGFESGPGARPGHPDWARSVRDQCKAAGVAFWFKQWGEWGPTGRYPLEWGDSEMPLNGDGYDCRGREALIDDTCVLMRRVGKKAAGHLLDGVEHREWPV